MATSLSVGFIQERAVVVETTEKELWTLHHERGGVGWASKPVLHPEHNRRRLVFP